MSKLTDAELPRRWWPVVAAVVLAATSGCGPGELHGPGEEDDVATDEEALVTFGAGGGCCPGTVIPVIFVPSNRALRSSERQAIEDAFADVRRWYRRELPGYRVRFSGVRKLKGTRKAEVYREGNMQHLLNAEYRAAWGVDSNTYAHAFVTIGLGFLGWAGGIGDGQRGFAVAGAESLVRQQACAGEWWCSGGMWRGTVIHETGHLLTLPHNDNQASIMQFHGDWSRRHLVEDGRLAEKTAVKNTLFVQRLPLGHSDYCHGSGPDTRCGAGEGDCDSDADCESGLRCRMNVGARYGFAAGTDVCVRDSSLLPVGAPCSTSSQCATHICFWGRCGSAA